MKNKLLILILLCSFFSISLAAQESTQTIRGQVIDRQSEMPLIGVAVEWVNDGDPRGATTDLDGWFSLENIPVGRQILRFSYLGYESLTLPNVMITAGKEVVLEITLAEAVINIQEVVVRATTDKDKANNEMATVSARSFTLEEVTRYSGGRNDVSRLAANFAGVNIADDSRNDIVIRGNSPTGVLWRLEGLPIPNPNHFSTMGTTGGPVSAVNTNLLRNSDFMTSAFPSEYGNALAGVFDIGFRNGNRDRMEFTAQLAAFSGLEFMAEGPLNRAHTGSFLVSYRHSFTELADAAGLNIGTTAVPKYKDLSFKLDLPRTKLGQFSLFGIGGLSDIEFIGSELGEDDFFADPDVNSLVRSRLGVFGVQHRLLIDEQTYLRTTVGASTSQNTYDEDRLEDEGIPFRQTEVDDVNNRYSVHSVLNRKFSPKFTLRTGFLAEWYQLDAFLQDRTNEVEWNVIRDFEGTLGLFQVYGQGQWRLNERWTVNGGLHAQYLDLNDSWALEPRLAVNYHLSAAGALNLGYGLHNQMQPLPMYFLETRLPDGTDVQSNRELEFTRSHHFVLGYDQKLGASWRLKTEAYFQQIENVPVESEAGSFSMLNVGADFVFPEEYFLVNAGSGQNYGLELTVEKFFSKGYYGLLTGSLFESKYKGSDGIERNTAFNNRYTLNVLAGKEFQFGAAKQNAFTVDLKMTTAGGRYYTPIDLEASMLAGEEVLDDTAAFSEQFDPYFRLDLKLGYRLNSSKRKFSQQFYLDFQNITNHQNIFTKRYSEDRNEIYNVYQIGFFPDLLYRVQF
ncbi:MAG: TonB-dependent receptor [Saprospiraceae bacterium]|nr:TonB-dependent receptor [Saprospiraceae bacterium]MCB0680709.1 TonB-dependent receptor [Saprospiraceae bacterium]